MNPFGSRTICNEILDSLTIYYETVSQTEDKTSMLINVAVFVKFRCRNYLSTSQLFVAPTQKRWSVCCILFSWCSIKYKTPTSSIA